MPDAQYLIFDSPPSPVPALAPFAAAPPAALLTADEADALRTILSAHAVRFRRIALVVVPFMTGLGAALAWTLFVVVLPSGEANDGRFSGPEAFSLLIIVVLWNSLAVWMAWDEALAAAPGPTVPFPIPRTVVAQVVAEPRTYRFRKAKLHRVRFPKHWTAPQGRARLRLIEPPRGKWARNRLGRAPLVLDAVEIRREVGNTLASPATPSPSPPPRPRRGQWTWDPRRRTLVPSSPIPASALGTSAQPPPRAGRTIGRPRPSPRRHDPVCPLLESVVGWISLRPRTTRFQHVIDSPICRLTVQSTLAFTASQLPDVGHARGRRQCLAGVS